MWANAQRDGSPAKHRWRPLFNATKFRWRQLLDCRAVMLPRHETRWNLQGFLKLANRSQPLVGRSSRITILWRHLEDILLLNMFTQIVDMCLSCEDIARQSCVMVPKCRIFGVFLGPAFPASRVQHVSDLHSTFALRPYHVWKYGRHPISDGWD